MDEAAFAEARDALARDRTHGASELARMCLSALAESARTGEARTTEALRDMLLARAASLVATRPSMAPIATLLGRWKVALATLDGAALAGARRRAAAEADRLCAESRDATAGAARYAAAHLRDCPVLMTISWSSTVLAALRLLAAPHPVAAPVEVPQRAVFVAESRPLNEGTALARELAAAGLATTLITDAQMGLFAGEAGAALVGADMLLADGSAVNKAGTRLLALACRDAGVPFYVCCESFKYVAGAGRPPSLEEKSPDELGADVPPAIRVRNVYFDLTPAHLISGWITEKGVATSPFRGIADDVEGH